ncbi:MAG TPA: acyltransferase [Desulfobulbaceae bacterium]|nr:acyltransferase [Desulfobulbaceae bacterium]
MKIRKLNALRGLAALIVVISHYFMASGLWHRQVRIDAGQLGVMIFFLLSAFLIAYLYWESQPSPAAIKKYAVARIARVLPLFLLVVSLSYVAQRGNIPFLKQFAAYKIYGLKSVLGHFLLIHGDGALWTIPPEIQFYILFVLVWLGRPRFFKWTLSILGLILLVYIAVWTFHRPPAVLFVQKTFFGIPATFSIIAVLPYFIAGLLFGHLFHFWQPPAWLRSHWFILILLVIPLLGLRIYAGSLWWSAGIFVSVSLVFFAVVFLVPPGNLFLENKIGDKLGEISYSLYLLHGPVLVAAKKSGLVTADVKGLALFLSFSVIVAFLSFTFFEAPARRRIRKMFLSGGP